ncbi:MAG: sigma-54-dependent Fis family transcriptional regulator [Eubacteriaceae bacterium]|nr:sigma-54-dependent Fis family transcriptional regulator [Eubacteriaceae bacterium]
MLEQIISQEKDYIIRSHKRCREYKVEFDRIYSRRILSEKELFTKLEMHRELILTAAPFMNQLYSFVKGSNFFAILTDREGCILSVIGDEEILTEAFAFKMIPGAYMDEKSIGTNAMGTSLIEEMPLQVSGNEHYVGVYHRWTCSAAPIRNPKGEIIASLDLSGYSETVHSHTLGMVAAAANAIERMLESQSYARELSRAKRYNEAVLDSLMAGIVTTDLEGKIVTVNSKASDMFGFSQDEMENMNAREILKDWERIKKDVVEKNNVTDEDVDVHSRKNKLQFNLGAYPILDENKEIINTILVFKEVRKQRKLSDKLMGRHAIYTFDKIIGKNENFLRVINFAKKVADSRSNVLIMGESGTGKELFAQSIHNYSNRASEPFVALNCGAIPRNLIESELFGYDEGAFTGAKTSGQPGKFEIADGGTIFLDEIGEMPLDLQTRLLRVIEEGTVSRIGSVKETVVSVRVIAATNKDLNEEVGKGNFRKDLYYRLNVLPIRIPSLKERRDDIGLLIEYFMGRISKKLNKKRVVIPDEDMQRLLSYTWPGNVRELENFIELVVNTETVPDIFHLSTGTNSAPGESPGSCVEKSTFACVNLEQLEREHIIKVLNINEGNITTTSRELGIGRNTLYRKLESYGIDCSETRRSSKIEQ